MAYLVAGTYYHRRQCDIKMILIAHKILFCRTANHVDKFCHTIMYQFCVDIMFFNSHHFSNNFLGKIPIECNNKGSFCAPMQSYDTGDITKSSEIIGKINLLESLSMPNYNNAVDMLESKNALKQIHTGEKKIEIEITDINKCEMINSRLREYINAFKPSKASEK